MLTPIDKQRGLVAPSGPPPVAAAGALARDRKVVVVPLTTEEQALVDQGLLPATFAELAAIGRAKGVDAAKAWYHRGKQGPFSPGDGDPEAMLAAAKRLDACPPAKQLAMDVRRGDLVLISYNTPDELIAKATDGPFSHVLMCTEEGPPAEFIEAVGVTGNAGDPTGNRVRIIGLADGITPWFSYRLMSPAGHLPPKEREAAVDAAIKFAKAQLGKPYDYTFGHDGVDRSFYCSNLAYEAYTRGAKLPIPISKVPHRDTLLRALDAMVTTLAPADRKALMDEIANKLIQRPAPTTAELVKYAVERVLPSCEATRGIARTPAERARLRAAIGRFSEEGVLPSYQAAARDLDAAKASGRFNGWLLGTLRHAAAVLRLGGAIVADMYRGCRDTGLTRWQTITALWAIGGAALPFGEPLAGFVFGAQARPTRVVGSVLDVTGWLKHHLPRFLVGWLPVRATTRVDDAFIGPTDLGWASLPRRDYNVPPGVDLDRPIPKAK